MSRIGPILITILLCSAFPLSDSAAESKSCATLIGGAVGDSLPNPDADAAWIALNSKIANYIFEDLTTARYSAVKIVVNRGEPVIDRFMQSFKTTKCLILIQIGHSFEQPEKEAFFNFNTEVMHIDFGDTAVVTPGGRQATFASDFNLKYRYPLTQESIQEFDAKKFASTVAKELKDSAVMKYFTK